MKPTKSLVITKRDGTLERYSPAKLRSCLVRVIRAGAEEPQLAAPLAQAITLHLRERPDPDMPTSDYLFGCVRAALVQTGLIGPAQVLEAHRRLRDARRQRVRVSDPLEPGREPVRWRKSAIVATLQNVYDLRQAVARFLAGRIEERVFGLGYRLLSKPFVAELVRNEVLAWGLLFERVPASRSEALVPDSLGREPPKEG